MTDINSGTSSRRQADRNRRMRNRLVDATIECLDLYGMTGTSISAIQDKAGVSRGALLHHFPSRQELIAETARRLLEAAIKPSRPGTGKSREANSIEELLKFYWDYVMNTREGRAFIEILIACRTDEGLDTVLADTFKNWDTEIAEVALARFSSTGPAPDDAAVLWAICRTFLRGLIIHTRFMDDPEYLERMIRRFADLLGGQFSINAKQKEPAK